MNQNLKLHLISIGLVLLIAGATAQSQFKFGVIDTQKVVENYKKAQDANEVLKAAGEKLKDELEKMREEIRQMEEKLTKQKLFLNEPQTVALETEIRQRMQEYERELKTGQESILAKEKELYEPILKEIETLIKQIGENEKYSLILDKRLGALYVDVQFDLTDRIIEKLNSKVEQSASKPDASK